MYKLTLVKVTTQTHTKTLLPNRLLFFCFAVFFIRAVDSFRYLSCHLIHVAQIPTIRIGSMLLNVNAEKSVQPLFFVVDAVIHRLNMLGSL